MMNVYDVIKKKRDGKKLNVDEINWFTKSAAEGDIADYQVSAMLMAMFINGLDEEENVALALAMKDSGDTLDLSGIEGITCDKHSSGGVGDKTTLIACPLAAALGVKIAKMSGRGLGFTGGTADKLSAIPGYRIDLSREEFLEAVMERGIALIGPSMDVAKADKLFYALRDVTATIESIDLISASIMSKKLALGSDAILLDVKCGSAAFMKDERTATALAERMVTIGKKAGKKVNALVTRMDAPLGCAVGNAIEVKEAIEVLQGKHFDSDITKLSVKLAAHMVMMAEQAESVQQAEEMVIGALHSGKGLQKLKEIIAGQGGDANVAEKPETILPRASFTRDIVCEENGYVNKIDGLAMGTAAMQAGAGRKETTDEVDHAAGIMLDKAIGDEVASGERLATVYANDEEKLVRAVDTAHAAFEVTATPPKKRDILIDTISSHNIHI